MISPDSCLVHKTWAHAPRDDGGLGGVDFPMMEVILINCLVHDTFSPSENCGFQFFECHLLRTPYVLDICQPLNLGHPRGTCKPVEHLGRGGGCVRQVSITGPVTP